MCLYTLEFKVLYIGDIMVLRYHFNPPQFLFRSQRTFYVLADVSNGASK